MKKSIYSNILKKMLINEGTSLLSANDDDINFEESDLSQKVQKSTYDDIIRAEGPDRPSALNLPQKIKHNFGKFSSKTIAFMVIYPNGYVELYSEDELKQYNRDLQLLADDIVENDRYDEFDYDRIMEDVSITEQLLELKPEQWADLDGPCQKQINPRTGKEEYVSTRGYRYR